MRQDRTFAVVELAGYVGENDRITGLASYAEADAWIAKRYSDEDRERLHVDIAADTPDGRTYEC